MRVLPADIYDAFEEAAETFDGIGSRRDFCNGKPWCIHGLRLVITKGDINHRFFDALICMGITRSYNDTVVQRVQMRNYGVTALQYRLQYDNKYSKERITFKEWCTELNLTRGDADHGL